jgi:hypothetical protein
MPTASNPEWGSYEDLTHELMRRIGAADGISTLRLERNVTLSGRASANQIDVLWEFRDQSDRLVRLLFECRSLGRRITQQALHSWRSVIDDVSEPGVETIGVMVTTIGYQAGAQRVADTYGIVICELRTPNKADLAGRIQSVSVKLVARLPQLTDLSVKATEQIGPHTDFDGRLGEFFLDLDDETSEGLADVLFRGELTSLKEPPTAPHRVTRTFVPPVILRRLDEPIARVWEISATVSEVESDPMTIETRMGRIAWVLANTLTGSYVWFAEDGRIWQTPS